MGRRKSNRHIAAALLKTIKRLEADTSVDQQDPAFIQLKCNLIQRLMSLEVDTAEIEASIHLLGSSEQNPADPSEPAIPADDTAIA